MDIVCIRYSKYSHKGESRKKNINEIKLKHTPTKNGLQRFFIRTCPISTSDQKKPTSVALEIENESIISFYKINFFLKTHSRYFSLQMSKLSLSLSSNPLVACTRLCMIRSGHFRMQKDLENLNVHLEPLLQELQLAAPSKLYCQGS